MRRATLNLSPEAPELTADFVEKANQDFPQQIRKMDRNEAVKELAKTAKDLNQRVYELEMALTWSTMKMDAVRLYPNDKGFNEAMREQAQKNKVLLNID